MDPGERAGQFKVFIRDRAGPLKERGVTQVVIAGVATSFGVESTARQAYDDGYNVTLAIDAMTDVRAESHEHSVTRVFPVLERPGPRPTSSRCSTRSVSYSPPSRMRSSAAIRAVPGLRP
jgi:hypothetical protein